MRSSSHTCGTTETTDSRDCYRDQPRLREGDEWFDEQDDLDRVAAALGSIDGTADAVVAAAVLTFRVARAQGFGEGNKRTALLLGRWVLDENGLNGRQVIPISDRAIADLLVRASSGADVEAEIVELYTSRA